jgi:hypothetical protein
MTTHDTIDRAPAWSTHASGTFSIDSWDQADAEVGGGTTTSTVQLTKTFEGDLTGTSAADLVMIALTSGARAYCGLERVTGTVAGRAGGFVLRHAAEGDSTGGWMTWQVMQGSGEGELVGVHGEGQITRQDDGSHSYRLDLTID